MIQPKAPEKKKSLLDRLPKLGRVSQLVLLIGIFLILFVPLFLINQQQPAREAELQATLANLQKIVAVEETPKAKLEAEMAQIKAETESSKAVFPNPNRAPEILDTLLELARLNDIYVTQTRITISRPDKAIGPILAVELGLKGQVPKFQNFLLALDNKLPTAQIKRATFTIAAKEGEYDTASIIIDIYCYEGSK